MLSNSLEGNASKNALMGVSRLVAVTCQLSNDWEMSAPTWIISEHPMLPMKPLRFIYLPNCSVLTAQN